MENRKSTKVEDQIAKYTELDMFKVWEGELVNVVFLDGSDQDVKLEGIGKYTLVVSGQNTGRLYLLYKHAIQQIGLA